MMIYVSDSPMGENICYLRRKKKITRANLARQCGMPYLTLYCIENGTLLDIDYEQLIKICTVLRVSVEDLIERRLKP